MAKAAISTGMESIRKDIRQSGARGNNSEPSEKIELS